MKEKHNNRLLAKQKPHISYNSEKSLKLFLFSTTPKSTTVFKVEKFLKFLISLDDNNDDDRPLRWFQFPKTAGDGQQRALRFTTATKELLRFAIHQLKFGN